jgi:hypothetical protein
VSRRCHAEARIGEDLCAPDDLIALPTRLVRTPLERPHDQARRFELPESLLETPCRDRRNERTAEFCVGDPFGTAQLDRTFE